MANKKTKNANGEGSVFYDEANKRWRCQISYKALDGATKRKSFSGKTKTDVRKKRNDFLSDLARGDIVSNSKATIVDLLSEQADYLFKINKIKESSYRRRLYTIEVIKKYEIANIPISELNEQMINNTLFVLKNKYSNSVIEKVFSAISQCYKLAIHKNIVVKNLMDSPFVQRPKADRKDKNITAFTVEEQKIFLDAILKKKQNKNSINYMPLLLIELFAGLRMGEICALTPKDIDFEACTIHVSKTVQRGIEHDIIISDTTKTKAGMRDVPIPSFLVAVLKSVVSNYKPNKYNLLFYNFSMDRPITTQQVNDAFKRLCVKCGIKIEGGQHLLRHTFATRAIEANVPANVLMKWMGHSDISITLNTYCDVFDRFQNKALSNFSSYCEENFQDLSTCCTKIAPA